MPALLFPIHLRLAFCLLAVFSLPQMAQAQTAQPQGSSPKTLIGSPKPAAVVASKPSWAELTPMQQQSLQPLAASWSALSEGQKRKWLEVSKSYPNLPAADQAVMHSRMVEWVAMSPQQRAAARLNFAKAKELSKQLTAEEKKAKWQTYQALSPEEKARLASKAAPKPAGAATAVKPVAPQKLAITARPVSSVPAVGPATPATTVTGSTPQNVSTPNPSK